MARRDNAAAARLELSERGAEREHAAEPDEAQRDEDAREEAEGGASHRLLVALFAGVREAPRDEDLQDDLRVGARVAERVGQ